MANTSENAHSWNARRKLAGNRFDLQELGGAFGDLGTLIPFVVGYVAVTGADPFGILFMFGCCSIAVGLYFKTPVPLQPMKAIGGAAIAAGGLIGPAMICGAGLFTGLFWLVAGATGLVDVVARLASRPVVRGIVLGLGLSFITQGVRMMLGTPWLAAIGLIATFLLLGRPKIPAMFALLILGSLAAFALDPGLVSRFTAVRPCFRTPSLVIAHVTWRELLAGATVLAIPQLPLTFGNAILAVRDENNRLFPDRPVTDRTMAISQGLINLLAAPFGGLPMCHGAGGMAGHVRFGARTGGALVLLGGAMVLLALFFSHAVGLLFGAFPAAMLGVILFFAGAELAITIRDVENKNEDIYVMLVVAGIAMWNMGAAFLAGIVLHQSIRRGWVKL
jgi:MFS superfamily sulfate permease-like transporter